ncbi:MAG: helix-turn-helix domain-containing protein [Odoribacter sp.]|nr:helix-turn-helix domain-containing protein [Odoribacter sp.]
MEVITMESAAFQELKNQIGEIAAYVKGKQETVLYPMEDIWIDSEEAADLLKVSLRTLQRRRDAGAISYSKEGRRCLYQLSELHRIIRENIIKSDVQLLEEYHQNYAKRHVNK